MGVQSFGNPAAIFRSRFGRTGNRASVTSRSVTGGTITAAGIVPGNGYRYHVFTSPGTFIIGGPSIQVDFIVVAGGGGGGYDVGGGGGSGGIVYGPSYILTPGSYPITVGGPGTGTNATPDIPANRIGGTGGDSYFNTIVAKGGGGGGGWPLLNAVSGGSGGGGSGYTGSVPGQPGTQPSQNPGVSGILQYGNPGGNANSPSPEQSGGGGGGAGAPGSNSVSPSTSFTPRAAGQPFPAFAAPLISPEIPAPVQPSWIPSVGPTGIYGTGGRGGGDNAPGQLAGVNYTGGGGDGAGGPGGGAANEGKAGGSGIVIIRYLA